MDVPTTDAPWSCTNCGAEWPRPMRFCGDCGAATTSGPVRRHDGELRLLSIVFCDVVGSTEWSMRLDPEDLRNLIRDFQRVCHGAVEALGGRIINFLGDGVLASFGAPLALEDSARRAVDAALEMVRVTARLTTPDGQRLSARAAVHTGFVVLGQMGEGMAALELDVIGEAANAAARLQGHAPKGGVLVSDAAAQVVAGRFVLHSIGDVAIRGLVEPMGAHEVVGRTSAVDRLSARAVAGLTPFIGREIERGVLVRRCAEAAEHRPQIVVVVGEPGIGKSRLIREARRAPDLASTPTIMLRGEQDRASTPFGPFAALVDAADPESVPVPADIIELLASPTVGETADRRRRRTIDVLCDWMHELASSDLLLVVIEDLHWVDPSTIEVVTVLYERSSHSRLAVLASARSPWVSPWTEVDGLTVVALDRLDDGAITELLDSLGAEDLSPIRQLVSRAEGVPLYLEEIAALATRGKSLDAGQVPITIAELLSSRLEATGDGELASDCSVLGLDIDLALAARVLELEPADLRKRLEHFVRSGIMRSQGARRGYEFRHGLLRDAAYGMLLRSDRHRLHAAAATALGEQQPDGRSEEIARHWEAADDPAAAWRAWERAGDLAARRSAFVEAAAFYDSALRMLRMVPPTAERVIDELTIVLAATTVSYRLYGGAASETMTLRARSEHLADAAIADTELDRGTRLMLMAGLHGFYASRPDYARAAELAPELEALSVSGGTSALIAVWLRGSIALMTGDHDGADRDFRQCLDTYDPRRKQLGQPDIAVVAAASLAHVATARDDLDAADDWLRAAFDYLAIHDEPFHRAWLTMTSAKVLARRDDRARAHGFASEAHELSLAQGFEQVEPQARSLVAWASTAEPDDEMFETIRGALRDMDASGSRADSSIHLLVLARSLHQGGRLEEGRDAYRALLAFCGETGEWLYRGEIDALGRQLKFVAPSVPDPVARA